MSLGTTSSVHEEMERRVPGYRLDVGQLPDVNKQADLSLRLKGDTKERCIPEQMSNGFDKDSIFGRPKEEDRQAGAALKALQGKARDLDRCPSGYS